MDCSELSGILKCSLCSETAQLLLIVSDGRGLFLEGKERVTAAVQAARNANIFVIFVVLDNPNSRVSEQGRSIQYALNEKPIQIFFLSFIVPYSYLIFCRGQRY